MENSPESTGISRNEKGQFQPGVSGNPAGRPPGSISIVAKIKKIFEEQPEYFEQYVNDVLKDPKLRAEIIRQIDGAPRQAIDHTSKGEALQFGVINYGDDSSQVPA